MTKLDADTFVTVEEAANILNVKRRTVDRYAEEGALQKFKLGKRRSGFKLADIEAHIARMSGMPLPGLGGPMMAAPDRPAYQSPGSGTLIEVPGMLASEAEAFHALLTKHGYPGVMVMLRGDMLVLSWADALGYTEAGIEKAISKAVRKGERFKSAS